MISGKTFMISRLTNNSYEMLPCVSPYKYDTEAKLLIQLPWQKSTGIYTEMEK
jgi:hypothetical protein